MPFIPAAVTGGLALGGQIAGAIGKGRAENRAAQNDQQYQAQQQALQAALFNRQAPGMRMGNAARGDILANVQPASFSGSGRDLHLGGGLNPTLLSPDSRQLGQSVTRQALLSQLGQTGGGPLSGQTPEQVKAALDTNLLPDRQRTAAQTQMRQQQQMADPYTFNPEPYQPKQANWLDRLLTGAGIAGAGASMFPARSPRGPLGTYTRGLLG
jgi:hypothetical protein